MKTLFVATAMLLSAAWTVSFGQGIRIQPRWQQEAIVLDLIRLDQCDSTNKILTERLANALAKQVEMQGIRIYLETKVDTYENTIVPAKDSTIQELRSQTDLYVKENKGLKKKLLLTKVVAGAVVVVAVLIAL